MRLTGPESGVNLPAASQRVSGFPGLRLTLEDNRSLLNERLQHMLSEFRKALYEAISDSTDVHRTWRQLREEGYSLYLLVDCKKQEGQEALPAAAQPNGKLPLPPQQEPVFQINGTDLSFRKSIGIDPTRRRRR